MTIRTKLRIIELLGFVTATLLIAGMTSMLMIAAGGA